MQVVGNVRDGAVDAIFMSAVVSLLPPVGPRACRALRLELDVVTGRAVLWIECPACAREVSHPDARERLAACPVCHAELDVDVDDAPILFAGRVIG